MFTLCYKISLSGEGHYYSMFLIKITSNIFTSFLTFLFTDKAIKLVHDACKECGYVLLVTADHGNAEVMKDVDGKPVTKHTTNRGKLS